MNALWLVNGRLVTPHGVMLGAVGVRGGRITAIQHRAPRKAEQIDVRGAYAAPGFIDLHVWGPPETLSRECVKGGATAFLRAIGPGPRAQILDELARVKSARGLEGAQCLGAHLEGPYLNPARGGALAKRWMRPPSSAELEIFGRTGVVRLITLAPELPRALEAIRCVSRYGVVASLGHTDADAETARRAVDAGARAVTHVFNGMRSFHHRSPSLLDAALTDPRLVAMVICDGVHVSPSAFRLLVRAKGPERIALVTDSIRLQGWKVVSRRGAYYLKSGVLAGSRLTMIEAVKHAVEEGAVSLPDAVRMASDVPARLLRDRARGVLAVGKRADLVVFDQHFRVRLTIVGGHIVHQR